MSNYYVDINPDKTLDFVMSHEGTSSNDIARKLGLISPGKPDSGLCRLRVLKRMLGDQIFIQRDRQTHKWFSGEYAKKHNLKKSVTPDPSTYSGRVEQIEHDMAIKAVAFINQHFIIPDSMKGEWLCQTR